MKISQAVEKLLQILKENGDLDVRVLDEFGHAPLAKQIKINYLNNSKKQPTYWSKRVDTQEEQGTPCVGIYE